MRLRFISLLLGLIAFSATSAYSQNWLLLGNSGTNDPAVPGTYGSSTIGGTENWVGTTDGQDLVFGTNQIERMRIMKSTGNVGIGLAYAGYKLTVSGGTSRFVTSPNANYGYIEIIPNASGASSIEIASGTTGGTNNTSQLDFKGSNNLTADFRGRIKYTDGTGFGFNTGGSTTDRMVITDGGAVGIGTTPASGKIFHVLGGNSKFEYNTANYVEITSLGGVMTMAGSGGISGIGPRITFIDECDVSTSADGMISYIDSYGMDFFTNGTTIPDMRIQADGKVVIGDPSVIPTTGLTNNYQLFVANGIITERLKVALRTSTDWNDHVFSPDYQLLSLDSVEMYTKENCHLPGMPSADDLVLEGIDVAKMDALLLKQIEELWLQMFLLKKENEELRKMINN